MDAEGDTGEVRDRRFRLGGVLTLAGAHFTHDVYTALLAPLLPLIIDRLGLSLALAGTLTVFTQLPSLANAFLGAIVDRLGMTRWLVILSPSVTAAGMCLVGVAPSYGVLVILLLTVGLSVAAVHVAAPVLIAEEAGDRLGRGTSLFMVGGELARTAGPIIAVQAVSMFGLEGLWRLAIPALLASFLLWLRIGRGRTRSTRPRDEVRDGLITTWRKLGWLLLGVAGVLVGRALVAASLTVYLPTLLYVEGSTLWLASLALSSFEIAGAVGALTSGTVSDWLGRRSVLLAAVVSSPILLLLFLSVDGALMFPVLLALGFVSLAITPVLMAVMLERSGGNKATSNGTFMMMIFTVRSLVVPLTGALGDAVGLRSAFMLCACAAFIGVPSALLIPKRAPE